MKKSMFYLVVLMFPLAIHAQYSGGNGRGDGSLALNGTYLSNWFKTAGNWALPANWSEGYVPPATEEAKVAADATMNADYSYPDLLIASNGSVTMAPGTKLTVTGIITNEAGTGGLIMKSTSGSNSSLLNETSGVQASVIRTIEKNSRWHFLSSPVNQAIMPEICNGNFAPLTADFNAATGSTYDFFYWQEPYAPANYNWISLKKLDWSVNTADFGNPPRFVAGKGYLVQYSPAFAGSTEKSAEGSLGTGIFNIPVTKSAGGTIYNLVGNPYPSYIDWKAPNGWSRTVLEEQGGGVNMWIWNGSTGNYGVYNSASASDAGTNGVTRYVPMEQGFFVKAASNGNLTMIDDVRCHGTQTWLKSEVNILRLNVTTPVNEYSDEIMVEFGHSAIGGAEKWFSMIPEAQSLYMPVGDDIFSIRFLGDVSGTTALPVSFKAGQDGNYSLTADGTGSFSNIILTDLKTTGVQDLKQNPVYQFSSSVSDMEERFLLRFNPVGLDDRDNSASGIFSTGNIINIINPGESVMTVYNMIGQTIAETRTHKEPVFRTKVPAGEGYYIVKVTTGENVIAKRIYIK